MAYTFECGSCHAIYKLDEKQITLKGVKITCPKCLSYFILKKGKDESDAKADSAYIEYVMDDGIHEAETTVTKPSTLKTPFDSEAKTQKIPTIPRSHIKQPYRSAKIKSMKIEASTAPYPTVKKKKNKAIPYLLVTFIIIAAIVLLYWKVL